MSSCSIMAADLRNASLAMQKMMLHWMWFPPDAYLEISFLPFVRWSPIICHVKYRCLRLHRPPELAPSDRPLGALKSLTHCVIASSKEPGVLLGLKVNGIKYAFFHDPISQPWTNPSEADQICLIARKKKSKLTIMHASAIRLDVGSVDLKPQHAWLKLMLIHNWPFSIYPLCKSNFLFF